MPPPPCTSPAARTAAASRDKQALVAAREAARPRDTGQSERIYQAMIEAIGRLPEEHKAPLLCRYVDEASYAEIALRTGRTAFRSLKATDLAR